MRRRTIGLTATLLAALLLGGAAHAADARVTIDNFSFSPATMTVERGATVTWANRDDIPHTVTDAGNPRAFKSAPLDTDDTFSYTFASPGTYHYFCSLHPHMEATVVVK